MADANAGADFQLVGGRLGLDFLNTVSGRLPNPAAGARDFRDLIETERLAGWRDLVRWGAASGALAAADARALERAGQRSRRAAARVVARAHQLRESAYRVFVALLRRWPPRPGDLAVVNRELLIARRHERLLPAQGRLGVAFDAAPALDRVLWPVARSLADLLVSEERARVRQCGGDSCGWLFLDTTRNHSRRWCVMADCGNLAKVRRFRRRR